MKRRAPVAGEIVRRFHPAALAAAGDDVAAGDAREFEFIASTAEVDRYGDSVSQSGWQLDAYLKNPALLWAHDYSLPPVGTVVGLEVRGGNLVARARLVSAGISALADTCWGLIREGALRAVSVGFAVNSEDDMDFIRDATGDVTGFRYLRPELLEISLCGIGANASALISRGLPPHISEEFMEPEIVVTAPPVTRVIPPEVETPAPNTLRRIAGGGGRPSAMLTPDIVRSYQQSGGRQNFASFDSVRELARVRSIVNSGGLVPVPGGTTAAVSAADPRPVNLLIDLLPVEPRAGGKIHASVIGYGTNNAAIVAEGALKPQSDLIVTGLELSFKKVAHWACVTDEELDDIPALRGVIDEELTSGLLLKIDTLVILAAIIAGATTFSPAADSTLVDNAAMSLALLGARGERGAMSLVNPGDFAAALIAKDGEGRYLAYPPGVLASIQPSPTIPAGKILTFAPRGMQIYERQSESVVIGLKNDDFIKNQKTILAEWRGNAAVTVPALVLYGNAVGA
jgi:HK97 family phage major capsid protein